MHLPSLMPNVRSVWALIAILAVVACSGAQPATTDGRGEAPVQKTASALAGPTIGPEIVFEPPVDFPADASEPAIASNGTDYLVVWLTDSSSYVYATRVSGAGKVLDPTPTVIDGNDNTTKTQPRVAWDGTGWLVVWSESGGVYAAHVATDGTVSGGSLPSGYGIPIGPAGNEGWWVDVAYDGTELLVVYSSFLTKHVYGVRVQPGGAVLDTTPIAISTDANYQQVAPRVVFDGTEFFVAWADSRASTTATAWDVYGARVSGAGVLFDGPPDTGGMPISTAAGDQTLPCVVSSGIGAFVAWSDTRGASPAYYGARVDPATGLVDGPAATGGIHLADATYAGDNAPASAFDGMQYVLAWSTGANGIFTGPSSVEGVRVSAAGTLLGAPGSQVFPISTASGAQSGPAIAGVAAGALAVWEDTRLSSVDTVFATRIDTSGALLDGPAATGGFVAAEESSQQIGTVVAAGTAGYLVAWRDTRDEWQSTQTGQSIYARRFDSAGNPVDAAAFPIATGQRFVTSLSAASSGNGYMVVWNEGIGTNGTGIFARFIDANGHLLNGPASSPGLQLTATSSDDPAAIAWNGTDYLFAWTDNRAASVSVYGMLVSQAGVVRPAAGSPDGAFALATGSTAGQQSPALDFDGTNFLLLWYSFGVGVYGSHIAPDGTRLDGAVGAPGFVVQSSAGDPLSIAYDGKEHVALVAAGAQIVAETITGSTVGASTTLTTRYPGNLNGVSVVYDGSVFWAFYYTDVGIVGSGVYQAYGQRLAADGSLIDTFPFTVGPAGDVLYSAAALSLPSEVLVAYDSTAGARGVIITGDGSGPDAGSDAGGRDAALDAAPEASARDGSSDAAGATDGDSGGLPVADASIEAAGDAAIDAAADGPGPASDAQPPTSDGAPGDATTDAPSAPPLDASSPIGDDASGGSSSGSPPADQPTSSSSGCSCSTLSRSTGRPGVWWLALLAAVALRRRARRR
jgi:MYXO-CTERM domain-containing protein